LAGELFVRFEDLEGGQYVKHGSGHIVKKDANTGYYILLTARTNLQYKTEEHDQIHKAKDGFFFLQRTDDKEYLARFKFSENNLKHLTEDEFEINSPDDLEGLNLEGTNLTAIVLKRWVKKSDIP